MNKAQMDKVQINRVKKFAFSFLLICVIGFFTLVMNASAITTSEVSAKLTALMNRYVGTTWNGNYYGIQCKGFANLIFKEIFGVQHIGAYENTTKYYIPSPSGAYEVGRLGFSEMTQSSAKNLLKKASPGDFIQVRRRNKTYGHSMIVVNVSDSGITVFDCNSDGKNGVKSYGITWGTFYNQNSAMSLYHANGYDAPAYESRNQSPEGSVDAIEGRTGSLYLGGWTLDKDEPTKALQVHVYVGNIGYVVVADKNRPDVGKAYPGVGDYHGFDQVIALDKDLVGNQTVRVYGINVGEGDNILLAKKMSISQQIPRRHPLRK